ncbi:AEC family transporter [Sandaracinus amylolyticus]|uniref:Transporter n=1 Tax=Sandaracinus amylolyticus TaxID=927083 RepID=A0A0F6W6Z2_9BACT|nr:AEC family transporter [Sandaracinus amylolyticus]AKF09011.1 Transporter [Sandaracinus amylolyticus]
MSLAVSLASLLLPVALGAIAGRARIFDDPARAIDALNRFALHLAFPALVAVSLSDPHTSIAHRPAFLAIVPLSLVVTLAIVRAIGRALGGPAQNETGTVALVVAFGNTAYLGLPYVDAVLGRAVLGTAAVAVAIHVACAMTLGPLLLARWSGGGEGQGRAAMKRVAKQPLLWSPLIGLALRALPSAVLEPLRATFDPIGDTAAPVSMVLLGLYLFTNRASLRADASVAAHVGARIVLVPLVTLAMALPALSLHWIDAEEARVLLLLAAMPAAITTFSMAFEQGIGSERVAAAIVASTLASALTLPLFTALALAFVG